MEKCSYIRRESIKPLSRRELFVRVADRVALAGAIVAEGGLAVGTVGLVADGKKVIDIGSVVAAAGAVALIGGGAVSRIFEPQPKPK